MLVLDQREKKGRITLSLWLNSVLKTYDRAAFIYFWKIVEVLNRNMTKEKRKLINLYFASLQSDKNDL